jgi:hypothetical protein
VRDRASATLFALSGLLLLTVLIAQPPSVHTQLAAAAAAAAAGIPIRYGIRPWPIVLAASLVALAVGASGVALFV